MARVALAALLPVLAAATAPAAVAAPPAAPRATEPEASAARAAVEGYLRAADAVELPLRRPYGIVGATAGGGTLGWLNVHALLWYPALKGSVNDAGGGDLDFRSDLGLDDNEATAVPEITFTFLIFSLRLDAYRLRFKGAGTITRTITFGGVTFNVNEDVTSDVRIDNYRFLSLLRFLDTDHVRLAVEGGISYYEFDSTVVGATSGTATVRGDLPLPVIGLLAQFRVGRFLVSLEASGMTFAAFGYDVTLIDAQASVAVTFLKIVEARVGYRYVRLDGDVGGFAADLTLDGFFVGVGVNF